jgi:hypothetical protein
VGPAMIVAVIAIARTEPEGRIIAFVLVCGN